MMAIHCILVLLLVWGTNILVTEGVTVDTKYGQVQGQTLTLHTGKSVNTFYNIPFAKPPVGPLRWQAPEEPDPWDDVYVASDLGAACPQSVVGCLTLTHPTWSNFDEDCLNLNIVTPADPSGGPYPVMFMIHGGGNSQGANFQYPGHFLAAEDVVTVFTNYRLGILGFASTMDDAARGNYGMLDQLLAMQFVQENIANFGGDPNKVTIFGESAGGTDVGLMLVSPMSTDLFHRAILSSGCEMSDWAFATPDQHPEVYLYGVAEGLNCTIDDHYEMMDCLRNRTVEELKRTRGNCVPGYKCSFDPVVDGPGRFLPDTPPNLRERGEFHKVPEMIGYNREDASLFTLAAHPGFMVAGPTRESFQEIINNTVHRASVHFPDQTRVDDVKAALEFFYTPWPHVEDRDKLRNGIVYMDQDDFSAPSDRQMKSHVEYAPVYSYVFGYVSSNYTIVPDWMGCCHIMELPCVFGHSQIHLNDNVRNESEIRDPFQYNYLDVEYSEFMVTLWTNFAKYGNPTPIPVQAPQNYGPVTWSPFTLENMDYILVSNEAIETRQNYRQLEFALWNEYLDWIVYGYDSKMQLDEDMQDTLMQFFMPEIFEDLFEDYYYD